MDMPASAYKDKTEGGEKKKTCGREREFFGAHCVCRRGSSIKRKVEERKRRRRRGGPEDLHRAQLDVGLLFFR